MDGKGTEMEDLLNAFSALEVERDYYRQVAESLGRKALADAQGSSPMIRDLRQREIKLPQSQEEFEKTIEERTAELVTRNKELSESTLHYESLVRRIPHGVYVLRVRDTGAMQFEYLSSVLCQILDIDPEEVQRNPGLAFSNAHPDDREGLERSLREATQRRIPFRWEGRFVIRQDVRWIRLEADPATTPTGDIIWNGVLSDITEQRQIQDKLKESEERLNFLVKNSSDSMVIINSDGSQRFVSPGAERITGYPIAELEGRTIDTLIHPDDIEEVMSAWNEAVEHPEKTVTIQYRHIHKTRGWVFSEAIAQSFLTEPAINGVIASVRDITERKHAEEAQENSRQRLESMFRAAPVGIGMTRSRVITEANDLLCKITGYNRDELIGQNARMLYLSQEEFERVGTYKYKQIEAFGTGAIETVWKRKDGTLMDVLLSSSPIDRASLDKGVTFTALDITEHKQAEKAKTDEQAFSKVMIDSIPGTFQMIDADGCIVLWNSYLRDEIVGKPEEQMHGVKVVDIVHPDDREIVGSKIENILRSGSSETVIGRFLLRGGPEFRWFLMKGSPILIKGKPFLVGIGIDISDQKKVEEEKGNLEAQLQQAQKMESVGRLAGGVAHDFNNMLSVILGVTELALVQVDPALPLFANLQEVRKAAERSADLTRQLLTFARKQTIAPRVVDLNEIVEAMLTMLRRLIGEDIDLLWKAGRNILPLKVDPTQIDQLLANLCINARDAIAGVGKVTIETDAAVFDEAWCADHAGFVPGEYVLLTVSDNGCGMDPETLDLLFEPFFTTKEMGKGTGLGLASVYGIVKQNNGFINVYSEPGQGTTFKVYLPRHAVTSSPLPEKMPGLPAERGHETVLLVEDEPAILKMATMMLETLGYTVIGAENPGEAIRRAHEYSGRIDLLLTDVVMPKMNGRDLAGNLLSHYPNLKCLFMSGYTADVIAHHGVLDEGVQFIQKPFAMRDLAARVRKVMG
jgi:PAS domain S-box-containing protein